MSTTHEEESGRLFRGNPRCSPSDCSQSPLSVHTLHWSCIFRAFHCFFISERHGLAQAFLTSAMASAAVLTGWDARQWGENIIIAANTDADFPRIMLG